MCPAQADGFPLPEDLLEVSAPAVRGLLMGRHRRGGRDLAPEKPLVWGRGCCYHLLRDKYLLWGSKQTGEHGPQGWRLCSGKPARTPAVCPEP